MFQSKNRGEPVHDPDEESIVTIFRESGAVVFNQASVSISTISERVFTPSSNYDEKKKRHPFYR